MPAFASRAGTQLVRQADEIRSSENHAADAFDVPKYKNGAARQKYEIRKIVLRMRKTLRDANRLAGTHVREARRN